MSRIRKSFSGEVFDLATVSAKSRTSAAAPPAMPAKHDSLIGSDPPKTRSQRTLSPAKSVRTATLHPASQLWILLSRTHHSSLLSWPKVGCSNPSRNNASSTIDFLTNLYIRTHCFSHPAWIMACAMDRRSGPASADAHSALTIDWQTPRSTLSSSELGPEAVAASESSSSRLDDRIS
ncbi:uncharacterized protein M6B38_350200 [Iris pallida]|uniref:Uncharacterized protein n=1 Tax=Iris pallida TaxID=29817 RepID=A0AAX6GS41_IRIPA|nr:uncharacterized protein M6B38_350200 [Iris pallida]